MSNTKQRTKAIKELAMFFAEKGKVLTQKEYIDSPDKPVLFSGIRRVFRSYSRMLEMLKRQEPELFAMTGKKEQPKPAPVAKPVEPKEPKPKPAAVKPAVKPAEKVEK